MILRIIALFVCMFIIQFAVRILFETNPPAGETIPPVSETANVTHTLSIEVDPPGSGTVEIIEVK